MGASIDIWVFCMSRACSTDATLSKHLTRTCNLGIVKAPFTWNSLHKRHRLLLPVILPPNGWFFKLYEYTWILESSNVFQKSHMYPVSTPSSPTKHFPIILLFLANILSNLNLEIPFLSSGIRTSTIYLIETY